MMLWTSLPVVTVSAWVGLLFLGGCAENANFDGQVERARTTQDGNTEEALARYQDEALPERRPEIVDKILPPELQEPEPEVVEPAPVEPQPAPVRPKQPDYLKLEVKHFRTDSSDSKPIEFLFVLDDSRSMIEEIQSLADSVPQLFMQLSEAGLQYRNRILTMGGLLEQREHETGDKVYLAGQGYAADRVTHYDREKRFADKYAAVKIYDQQDAALRVRERIKQIAEEQKDHHNEPGICAAMDYINWSTFTSDARATPFLPDQKVHVIVLSDEDNDNSKSIVDGATNKEQGRKKLICHLEKKAAQHCPLQKYRRQLSWNEYRYTWSRTTEARREYTYKYRIRKKTRCQQLGYASYPEGKHPILKLRGDKKYHCVVDQKQCRDRSKVKVTYRRLAKFECQKYADGRKVWHIVNRDTAKRIMASGELQCKRPSRPEFENYTRAADVAVQVGFDRRKVKVGQVGECSDWDCKLESTEYSLTGYFDKYVVDAHDFQQQKRYVARKNESRSCKSDSEIAGTRHANPSLLRPKFHNSQYGLELVLTEKRGRCSAVAYQKVEDQDDYWSISSRHYCEANLKKYNLPQYGLETFDPRTDGPAYWQDRWVTYREQLSLADVRDRVLMADSSIEDIEVLEALPVKTSGGQRTDFEEVYIYDRYPEGNSQRNLENFVAHKPVAKTVEWNSPAYKKDLFPPHHHPHHRVQDGSAEWRQHVRETTVEDPNGYKEVRECEDGNTVGIEYQATPKNFVTLMPKLHPQTSFTFHSIANLKDGGCGKVKDKQVRVAEQYVGLSNFTGGIKTDICSPNFDSFVQKLTHAVIEQIATSYVLEDTRYHDPDNISSVQNASRGILIKFGNREGDQAYIEDGKLTFRDTSVISKGDQIRVYLKKRQQP
ncbi:MAG: hypothetical protein OXT67_01160 [Zetaproteobacteria bacterium]|nr:hypothetical protein [Zetaproteobacteria bacterium]